ncbi:FGGY-family carbohydrate kinase [Bacteroidota bacterium]
MKTEIILVFDIGKTNKKILLFNRELKIIHEEEQKFEEISDDDGFACDDISKIEEWILETCGKLLIDESYRLIGINFTTYGATIMYIDEKGRRLTPVYNYLKPMPEGIVESLYMKNGGIEEFCRKTASPALGMLNSGLQCLWLKTQKKKVFKKVRYIMHFPQYLSSILTGEVSSEHTSIGAHTALWDFDDMKYHDWIADKGLKLPDPIPVETTFQARRIESPVPVGIGIHDSSASLVPYFRHSADPFILISTGTWCINMNPFNNTPLTTEQLSRDCLAYLSIRQKPVKSSRIFLGHIHDINIKLLSDYFQVPGDTYKTIDVDINLLHSLIKKDLNKNVFFSEGMPEDFVERGVNLSRFENFGEAYHRFMIDLTDLVAVSIGLIIEGNDDTEDLYITGGFARNLLFVCLIASRFCDKKVYTSEVANSTSLGTALVIWKSLGLEEEPVIDLGLKLIKPIKEISLGSTQTTGW